MSDRTKAWMGSAASRLVERYYRGPGRVDGTTQFQQMLQRHLHPEAVVLEVGAGPGKARHDYRGRVRRIVGIDIDPRVTSNTRLDAGHVCDVTAMPLADATFDLAFADYVFEHLADPRAALLEIRRVLKPGGVLLARTPNTRHYATLISRWTPFVFHRFVSQRIRRLDPGDTVPTHYLCNSAAALRSLAAQTGFAIDQLLLIEKEPSYLLWSRPSFYVGLIYERVVNSAERLAGWRSTILLEMRRT